MGDEDKQMKKIDPSLLYFLLVVFEEILHHDETLLPEPCSAIFETGVSVHATRDQMKAAIDEMLITILTHPDIKLDSEKVRKLLENYTK